LRTSNFKFEFVFVFQPFDIRIQASLIRRRWFCLIVEHFSGALCDDFFVLCRPSIQATPTVCLLTPSPSPLCILPWLRLALLPWQAIKVTNLGGPDTEQTSIYGNRVPHGLTSWLIALLIDCFPACGVRAVTFISLHSADIKRKLLKLLHKYINEVRI